MNTIFLGNAVSFIGAIIMVAIGLIKKKQHILYVQCAQFGIMGLGNLILGGYTGALSNAVCIVRNLIAVKIPFTTGWKLVFILLQGVLSLPVNQSGLVGWLPFVAACLFTVCMDTKNEALLKLAIILGQLAWAVYDMYHLNYAAMAFDVMAVVTNLVGLAAVICAGRKQQSDR